MGAASAVRLSPSDSAGMHHFIAHQPESHRVRVIFTRLCFPAAFVSSAYKRSLTDHRPVPCYSIWCCSTILYRCCRKAWNVRYLSPDARTVNEVHMFMNRRARLAVKERHASIYVVNCKLVL
jgi:hypothetical protein